jgi:DNA replication protein DnaC
MNALDLMESIRRSAATSGEPPLREYKGIVKNIGKRYAEKSFENFTDKAIVRRVTEELSTDHWLYIHGESRTGKTHLACGMYRWYIDTGATDIFIRKSIDLDILFSAYDRDDRMGKVEALREVSVLIIDDIGVGKLTQERHSMYYYVLDWRLSNGLKTIFTANVLPQNLWAGSTDGDPTRIITRIQEASLGIQVTRNGMVGG